eukprot:9433251-Ditylum_brightwellii.AAC.1
MVRILDKSTGEKGWEENVANICICLASPLSMLTSIFCYDILDTANADTYAVYNSQNDAVVH